MSELDNSQDLARLDAIKACRVLEDDGVRDAFSWRMCIRYVCMKCLRGSIFFRGSWFSIAKPLREFRDCP